VARICGSAFVNLREARRDIRRDICEANNVRNETRRLRGRISEYATSVDHSGDADLLDYQPARLLGEPLYLATKKTGLPANPVDTVRSPLAPAGTATHVFPLAVPPLYKSPTSLKGSGMTPQRSS
jgi:hypothetical protein